MNRKIGFVLAAAVVVMAATAWAAYPSRKRATGDPSKYRYMHCPKCGREKMYTPAAAEQPCLYCEKPLVPTEESILQTGREPNNPYGKMFLALYAELLAVMAAVWYISKPRPEQADEDFLYLNCQKCRQKIRYREQQIGLAAMCRRCKHAFLYPPEGEDGE
jgi:ribosomal protein S27E